MCSISDAPKPKWSITYLVIDHWAGDFPLICLIVSNRDREMIRKNFNLHIIVAVLLHVNFRPPAPKTIAPGWEFNISNHKQREPLFKRESVRIGCSEGQLPSPDRLKIFDIDPDTSLSIWQVDHIATS